MEEEQKREFTGVWIPKHIIEDEDLSMTDRIIYSEIACFKECYKSNEKLGKRYNLKKNTISIIISKLIKKGYIKSNQKTGEYRRLSVNYDKPNHTGCVIKIKEPLSEKSKSLCDKNHTIDNNIENKKISLSVKKNFFFNLPSDQRKLYIEDKLSRSLVEEEVAEIDKFVDYWTESDFDGGKQKWHFEKTFNVVKRFQTWIANSKKWNVKKSFNKKSFKIDDSYENLNKMDSEDKYAHLYGEKIIN